MAKKTRTFEGRHWETGSIQNALALQDVKAPHTGRPYSEAFFLGVGGGIAFGYFTFEYKGFLPHLALLTRNTFNPFTTALERLGVVQHAYQTTKSEIAEKNLVKVLASGLPALVWADECSLAYNNKESAAYWNMMPVVVYALDRDDVLIADRSSQLFRVPMEELTKARARVKEDKFRLITLEPPQPVKLVSAIQKGIWQCVELFTERPPRGTRDNFGFAAYQKLADMLTNTRNKHSWKRLFAPGPRMYNALAGTIESLGVFAPPGAFSWIMTFGAGDGAERGLYADFLEEAVLLLDKKFLGKAADQFRLSHAKWLEFADALLPTSVEVFREVKKLILQKHHLFVQHGEGAMGGIREINLRLKEIESEMSKNFPLSNKETVDFRMGLREQVLEIARVERKAIELLQAGLT